MKACLVSGGTAPLILGNWLRVVFSVAHPVPCTGCPTYSHSSQASVRMRALPLSAADLPWWLLANFRLRYCSWVCSVNCRRDNHTPIQNSLRVIRTVVLLLGSPGCCYNDDQKSVFCVEPVLIVIIVCWWDQLLSACIVTLIRRRYSLIS
jgi:hypothetical protein